MLNGHKYFFITKTNVNVIMLCDPTQTPENKNNTLSNGFDCFHDTNRIEIHGGYDLRFQMLC